MGRNVCFFIYFIFLTLTARDIFSKWNESLEKATAKGAASRGSLGGVQAAAEPPSNGMPLNGEEDELMDTVEKKAIPPMSFQSTGNPESGPVVKITYCNSCGYAKAYEEYAKMLTTRYPSMRVIGGNHSPGFLKSSLAQALFFTKLAVIFALVINIDPFAMYNLPAPRIWNWMKEHKINACMIVFFLGNTLESVLMSSGAFEIYFNDVQIWSKIETGRVPTASELFELVNSQQRHYYQGETSIFGEDTLHTIPGRSY